MSFFWFFFFFFFCCLFVSLSKDLSSGRDEIVTFNFRMYTIN